MKKFFTLKRLLYYSAAINFKQFLLTELPQLLTLKRLY